MRGGTMINNPTKIGPNWRNDWCSTFLGDATKELVETFDFNPLLRKSPLLEITPATGALNHKNIEWNKHIKLCESPWKWRNSGAIMIKGKADSYEEGINKIPMAYTLWIALEDTNQAFTFSDSDVIINKVKEKEKEFNGLLKYHGKITGLKSEFSEYKDYLWIEFRLINSDSALVIDIDGDIDQFEDALSDGAQFLLKIDDERMIKLDEGVDCNVFITAETPNLMYKDGTLTESRQFTYRETTSDEQNNQTEEKDDEEETGDDNGGNPTCNHCSKTLPNSNFYIVNGSIDDKCKYCTEMQKWSAQKSYFYSFFNVNREIFWREMGDHTPPYKDDSYTCPCEECRFLNFLNVHNCEKGFGAKNIHIPNLYSYLQTVWNFRPIYRNSSASLTMEAMDYIEEIKEYIKSKYSGTVLEEQIQSKMTNNSNGNISIYQSDIVIFDIVSKLEKKDNLTLQEQVENLGTHSALFIEPQNNSQINKTYSLKDNQLFIKNAGGGGTRRLNNFSSEQSEKRAEIVLVSREGWSSMIVLTVGERSGGPSGYCDLNNGETFSRKNIEDCIYVYSRIEKKDKSVEHKVEAATVEDFANTDLIRMFEEKIEFILLGNDSLNFGINRFPSDIQRAMKNCDDFTGFIDGYRFSFVLHKCNSRKKMKSEDPSIHNETKQLIIALPAFPGIEPNDVMINLIDYSKEKDTHGRIYGESGHPGWGMKVSAANMYAEWKKNVYDLLPDKYSLKLAFQFKFAASVAFRAEILWLFNIEVGALLEYVGNWQWNGLDVDDPDSEIISFGLFAAASFDSPSGNEYEISLMNYYRYDWNKMDFGLVFAELMNNCLLIPECLNQDISEKEQERLDESRIREDVNRFKLTKMNYEPYNVTSATMDWWEDDAYKYQHLEIKIVNLNWGVTIPGWIQVEIKWKFDKDTGIIADWEFEISGLPKQIFGIPTHGSYQWPNGGFQWGGMNQSLDDPLLNYIDVLGDFNKCPSFIKNKINPARDATNIGWTRGTKIPILRGVAAEVFLHGYLGGFAKINHGEDLLQQLFNQGNNEKELVSNYIEYFENLKNDQMLILAKNLWQTTNKSDSLTIGILAIGNADIEISLPFVVQPLWSIYADINLGAELSIRGLIELNWEYLGDDWADDDATAMEKFMLMIGGARKMYILVSENLDKLSTLKSSGKTVSDYSLNSSELQKLKATLKTNVSDINTQTLAQIKQLAKDEKLRIENNKSKLTNPTLNALSNLELPGDGTVENISEYGIGYSLAEIEALTDLTGETVTLLSSLSEIKSRASILLGGGN
jgi:hypothetical protein